MSKFKSSKSSFSIVLSDMLITLVVIIMVFFTMVLLMPHSKNEKTTDRASLGQLCVEISWPNDRNIDIDLWGHAPGEDVTVGYTNMHSPTLNLYRDVIGFTFNPTHQMLEIMCADKVVPGHWTFNAMYFSNHEEDLKGIPFDDPRKAVEVTMVLRIIQGGVSSQSEDVARKYTFKREGQEKTMMDFIIDENGRLMSNSMNSNDVKLYHGIGDPSPVQGNS